MRERKVLRLHGWDYSSAGMYFLTVCAKDRQAIFGKIAVGDGACDVPQVALSDVGKRVAAQIREMTACMPAVATEAFVIMPNHVHILLQVASGTSQAPSPTNSAVAKLVSLWKRRCNRSCGVQLFQRSYYDRIVRTQEELERTLVYIRDNPGRWAEDPYYII